MMRKLPLCLGSSRQAAAWHPTMMTIEEIWSKVENPIRTGETTEQYLQMSKPEREAVKDQGAFLAGTLKGTRRKRDEVLSRSMLTLDYDKLTPSFFEDYERSHRFFTILYTTHSHLPETPRARLLIPLTRDVTPEEYNALVRYVAAEIGMEMVDICSFKINQPMFWPNCSSDGQYVHRRYEGDWLDPDKYLSAHPNWHDYSSLPTAPSEKDEVARQHKMMEDPLTKDGIVGAFCRTYSIPDVMEKYLSDVYAPTVMSDRYDYIQGEGTSGVVVYDDKFAYSHHATDPAGGKLLNAFDLVRLHKFGDEEDSFRKMCAFAEADEAVKKTLEEERVEQAQKDFEEINSGWEEPLPFGKHTISPFPTDALPPVMADFALSCSESIQVPPDMVGCCILSAISASMNGKYEIQAKPDWIEPTHLYQVVVAEPSERKSAAQHGTVNPLSEYENRYNRENYTLVETSRMQKRVLERKQKAIEEQIAKGKAEQAEAEKIAREITEYVVKKPLKLFVDDITPEKLASVLSANDGHISVLSSEAGLFDTFAGAYSKMPNIDVLLKSYSGDPIRVDRIGRDSESIMHPSLTILLMAQPTAISKALSNETFRGRGLTARFLYSMPKSIVGSRRYRSTPIPTGVYEAYEKRIFNLLEDEYSDKPERITLSPEADMLLEAFSDEIESRLRRDYADMADWCGKLAGNTLRIAGLLCRASVERCHDFLEVPEPLVVDELTMKNAIRLGRYFLNHAEAVFDVLPENAMYQKANRVLKMIHDKGLTRFNRRTAMRNCQSFKTVADIQPVLDFLEEGGYIAALQREQTYGKGRQPMLTYLVNPWVEHYFCQSDITSVIHPK